MFEISDIHDYNKSMTKSMEDKLFFLDRVNYNALLIDFGCADGSLLEQVKLRRSDISLLGHDISDVMRKEANNKGVRTTRTLDGLIAEAKLARMGGKSVFLLMSSVLHEVNKPIELLTMFLGSGLFKSIFIRDMHHVDSKREYPEKYLDTIMNYYLGHNEEDYGFLNRLRDFQNKYGSIKYEHNLLHFFLKYRYIDNWNRELSEDYFSFDSRDIIFSGCKVDYMECFTPEFIETDIKTKFNIKIEEPTHIKLILS